MTNTEASDLAKRIINTWRGGPPLVDWIEELEPLDHGMAGTAFVRLRRTSEHSPSIAKFLAEYRGVRGPTIDNDYRRQPENTMTLDEYLGRVGQRAAQGNQEATEELERWERFLRGDKSYTAGRA